MDQGTRGGFSTWHPLQGVTVGSNKNSVNALLCNYNFDITDLWSLEVVGIKDPIEQTQKSLSEQEMLKSFKRSIKINEEGRYEVPLPWRDIPRPEINFELARKRLDSTTKRLRQLDAIETYDEIFRE
jgi:hypothetical protein